MTVIIKKENKLIEFLVAFSVVATMTATKKYLNWSLLQDFGAAIVLVAVYVADKRGPVWRKSLLVALSFSLMVAGHFVIDDYYMYWGALLLSCVLFIASFYLLYFLLTAEPGWGSVLSIAFLGLVCSFPIAVYVLYFAMKGLGYL